MSGLAEMPQNRMSRIQYSKGYSGRLGNQLFQENIIRQLAYASNLTIKENTGDFNKLITGFDKVDNRSFRIIRKKKISREMLEEMTLDEIISMLMYAKVKTDYFLPSGLLGEYYTKFTLRPPSLLMPLRTTLNEKFENRKEVKKIAIHFRGGDYMEWNRTAVLNLSYYMRSIEHIKIKFGNFPLIWRVFTDDKSLETYQKIVRELHCKSDLSPSDAISDFFSISNSDVVISSPSTFSIWASILGRKKDLIIHCSEWVNQQAGLKDPFWLDMLADKLPFCNTLIH
jgi:Glycosyl transferase family 11